MLRDNARGVRRKIHRRTTASQLYLFFVADAWHGVCRSRTHDDAHIERANCAEGRLENVEQKLLQSFSNLADSVIASAPKFLIGSCW